MKYTLSSLVLVGIVIAMISSFARGFSSRVAFRGTTAFASGHLTPRISRSSLLSTTADGGPDTSIVDVCQQKIQKALETEEVKVTGAYDDPNGSHISIEVVSPLFEGKRPVQRQQLVYKAIWEELQGPVHAVDNMICKTPSE